jgi:hypothetical protein
MENANEPKKSGKSMNQAKTHRQPVVSAGRKPKQRLNLTRIANLAMLLLGAITLVLSIVYDSSVLAVIGLGLTFWGAILTYVENEDYVKKTIFDTTLPFQTEMLNQICKELDFKGRQVYLPPRYFKDPETTKIFIAKEANAQLPTPEQIQEQENQLFVCWVQNLGDRTTTLPGILAAPSGAELAKLFAKTLETSFTKTDLKYLQRKLPGLLVEDLEIAQGFEMKTENNKVHVKIQKSIFAAPYSNASSSSGIEQASQCILCSAIACALAKATGKPVTIEQAEYSTKIKTIEAKFTLLQD